ncbi:MAG TPA: Gfo/Idh/MocA family oxidoreductase [Phototrophicaceae bacterium]|nr:Gfo/Idh/MocA family oxidoreductase [Phototrophicaceae bacterium]
MSIRFAAIGLNHGHIYNQVNDLLNAGAELVWFYAPEPEKIEEFSRQYPQAKLARSIEEILEDTSIQVIASASIPNERAPLGVRVMQHGKDYLVDKPGFTTLEQLAEVRRVQAETQRIYAVHYSERFDNAATVKAGELVQAGAIGQVIQTTGFGPHRIAAPSRPDWFFRKVCFGGILNDIASHQVDQFLFFTGSTTGEVVTAQVGNVHHPQYPELEDFGDVVLRSDRATGYIRVDWLTPDGLDTWGDVRLFLLGTEGYIEIRKNTDLAGRPGKDHLFLVDQKETRYIDCSNVALPFGPQFVSDVLNRTETAAPQAHYFLASELILKAQQMAQVLAFKPA